MDWLIVLSLAVLGLARSRSSPFISFFTRDRKAPAEPSKNSEILDDMLTAIKLESDPIARHRLLIRIIEKTYNERHQPAMQKIFFRFAAIHLNELPQILSKLKTDSQGKLPNISTFKLMAIALEEASQYDEAIKVCEQALQIGMSDGTQTGFYGRIRRIRKKMTTRNVSP